ncbi:MAG: hypothetical protein HOP30_21060 [Cyclobacteriaceae bacterium]|nr:hypothetical protein [Cyclobacteriaceae bacterium]
MKPKIIICVSVILLFFFSGENSYSQSPPTTWTYTYLKAQPNQRDNLKLFLEKNWLVMDSIAISQKLIKRYELQINVSESVEKEWDYIVAVEYYENQPYEVIADRFNLIRQNHRTIIVNGFALKDLGRITKSELVRKGKSSQ